MTAFVTLVVLDLRALWMSFRLLLVLSALLASALVVIAAESLAPWLPGMAAYGLALAAGSVVLGATAAHTVAADRRGGPAAWLAVRAVPRSSLLLAWLSAFVPPVVGGLGVSALIAWPAFAAGARGSLGAFVLAMVAAAAACLAAIALGALLGTLLAPRPAAAAAAALAAALALFPFVAPAGMPLPSGGFALVAHLASTARPTALALQSTGAALLGVALLSVVGAAVLQRADL